jgi:O-antigen/teichoic acid export membrane protein
MLCLLLKKPYKSVCKNKMMKTQSLKEKIIKNIIYNNISYVIRIVLGLILTPYIFYQLGQDYFGIWAFVAAFIGYFSLLDFGIGSAVVKYTAEYLARKEYNRVSQLIISALFCYATLGLSLIPIFIFRNTLAKFFRVNALLQEDLSFVLGIATISFALSFIFSVFRSVLIGLQRMDITNRIQIVLVLLNAIGTVIALESGFGIRGLIIMGLIIHILRIISQFIVIRLLYPWVQIDLSNLEFDMIKRFISYGSKIQITGICGILNLYLDKILIGYFLNMALVGFYELGSKIAGFIRELPMLIFPAITPAASELDALKDKEKLTKLYLTATKYLVMVALPILFLLVTLAPTIIYVWLKNAHQKEIVWALRALSVGYFFNIITGIVTSLARGIGRPEYEMRSSAFISIMNFVLSIMLIIKFGFVGALIGTVSSLIIGNSIYLIYFQTKYIKESFIEFVINFYASPLFACFLGFITMWWINHLFTHLQQTYWGNVIFLWISGTSFIVTYVVTLILTRFITEEDLQLLKKIRL